MKKYSSWAFCAVGVLFFAVLTLCVAGCSSSSGAGADDADDGDDTDDTDGGDAVSACTGGTATGTSGITTQTLTVDGEERSVTFYAPSTRGSQPPLIIAFHGTSGSSADWVAEGDPAGLQALADEDCFVVAAPQARAMDEGDWDHEGGSDVYWETVDSTPAANPDLTLVEDLIDTATASFNINTNRIYSMGFSNGGFFSVLTAMALSDQIAAFAEAGSGLVTCETTRSCEATSTSTSCAAILSDAPAACTACDDEEKPVTIPATGPPGFLGHNNRDDVVSSYYTCYLADRLDDLGYTNEVMIGDAEGHSWPEGFVGEAWEFFSTRELGD